jgi:hypothetical protein
MISGTIRTMPTADTTPYRTVVVGRGPDRRVLKVRIVRKRDRRPADPAQTRKG